MQEPRVDVLEARRSALPDKNRAAAFEQRHAGIFLAAGAGHIHPERAQRAGQGAVQPARAHAPAIAISDVVLPDHKPARRRDRHVGKTWSPDSAPMTGYSVPFGL